MNVEAFILIGGRSSRFGRAKALAEIGGQTLAERSIRIVENSGVASKICFAAGDEVKFAIEAQRLDTPFIFDLIADRGPLGGLHAALNHAVSEWIFLFACDLPAVTSDLIGRLGDLLSDEFGAVIPQQSDGRLQPLCAFYKVAKTKPVVDEIMLRPRVSPRMSEIAELLDPRIVKPGEYAPADAADATVCFTNVNTEKDLEQVHELSTRG